MDREPRNLFPSCEMTQEACKQGRGVRRRAFAEPRGLARVRTCGREARPEAVGHGWGQAHLERGDVSARTGQVLAPLQCGEQRRKGLP